MNAKANLVVLFGTILGASYLLLFSPDSEISVTLMALSPLAWLGLFMLRFFSEKKKRVSERENNPSPQEKESQANLKDPDELMRELESHTKNWP